MNYKIIPTSTSTPDVLIYRDRDDEGTEKVIVMAIGTIQEGEDTFAIETVNFEHAEAARQYVQDFSVNSAEGFCARHEIRI